MMSAVSRKFIIKIIKFTLIILAIATVLFSTILKSNQLRSYPYLVLLIATVTTISHLWVTKASGQSNIKFSTAFMASTTLKLMVYLFFMLIYLMIDRTHVITFVLTFVALYVVFTVFEVIQIIAYIKK